MKQRKSQWIKERELETGETYKSVVKMTFISCIGKRVLAG